MYYAINDKNELDLYLGEPAIYSSPKAVNEYAGDDFTAHKMYALERDSLGAQFKIIVARTYETFDRSIFSEEIHVLDLVTDEDDGGFNPLYEGAGNPDCIFDAIVEQAECNWREENIHSGSFTDCSVSDIGGSEWVWIITAK